MQKEQILNHVSAILYYIENEYRDYISVAKYIGCDVATTQEALYKLKELGRIESKFLEDKERGIKIRGFKIKPGVLTYELITVITLELANKLKIQI